MTDLRAVKLTVHLLLAFLLSTIVMTACLSRCRCVSKRIFCDNQGMSDIPRNISGNIKLISLKNNNLKSFTGIEISHLFDLRRLYLQGNQIANITSAAFFSFSRLRFLDLSSNKIVNLPKNVFQTLPKLSRLDLSYNAILNIEGVLLGLTSLDFLDLSNNKIVSLSSSVFDDLKNLHTLLLAENNLTYSNIQKDAFGKLPNLQSIQLTGNPLMQVDYLFVNNEKLTSLECIKCHLQAFPLNLPLVVEYVQLSQNNLTKLTKSQLSPYINIRIIFLDQNNLMLIENQAFSGMVELSELWLSNNDLTKLPTGFPKTLKQLNVDSNRIRFLNGKNVFSKASQLETLSIRSNHLEIISAEDFQYLGMLKTLDLGGNTFKNIPDGTFGNLTALKELSFIQNDFASIGYNAFVSLGSLSFLDFSYIRLINPSRFSELGNFFHALQSLKHLNLQESPELASVFLSSLEMRNSVKNLQKLILSDNAIQTLKNDSFLPFSGSIEIDLTGNNFHCDTKILWLKIAIQEKYYNFNNAKSYICYTPTILHGQPIQSVPIDQFEQATESPYDIYDADDDDDDYNGYSSQNTISSMDSTLNHTSVTLTSIYIPTTFDNMYDITTNNSQNTTNSTILTGQQTQIEENGKSKIIIIGILAPLGVLGLISILVVLYHRKKHAFLQAYQYKKEDGFTSEENLVQEKSYVSTTISKREERGSVTSRAEEDITNDCLGINTKIYSWDGK